MNNKLQCPNVPGTEGSLYHRTIIGRKTLMMVQTLSVQYMRATQPYAKPFNRNAHYSFFDYAIMVDCHGKLAPICNFIVVIAPNKHIPLKNFGMQGTIIDACGMSTTGIVQNIYGGHFCKLLMLHMTIKTAVMVKSTI